MGGLLNPIQTEKQI